MKNILIKEEFIWHSKVPQFSSVICYRLMSYSTNTKIKNILMWMNFWNTPKNSSVLEKNFFYSILDCVHCSRTVIDHHLSIKINWTVFVWQTASSPTYHYFDSTTRKPRHTITSHLNCNCSHQCFKTHQKTKPLQPPESLDLQLQSNCNCFQQQENINLR